MNFFKQKLDPGFLEVASKIASDFALYDLMRFNVDRDRVGFVFFYNKCLGDGNLEERRFVGTEGQSAIRKSGFSAGEYSSG